jgi:ABC-type multidrug transport system fused ATPase/permease subunit
MQQYYADRCRLLADEISAIERKFRILYFLRLISFALFVAFLSFSFFSAVPWLYAILSAISFSVFLVVVRRDIVLLREQKLLMCRHGVNQNELKYLSQEINGFEDGAQFEVLSPHLSGDFDLFGETSLYQYINRAATNEGKKRLAFHLSDWSTDIALIKEKQAAVNELKELSAYLEHFQATGMLMNEEGTEQAKLMEWLEESSDMSSWMNFLLIGYPLFVLVLIGFVVFSVLPPGSLLFPFLVSFFIIDRNKKLVNVAHEKLGKSEKVFEMYGQLIQIVEQETFQSPFLQRIQKQFSEGNEKGVDALKRLHRLLDWFDMRYNLLVSVLFNVMFLFDLQILHRLNHWKQRHRMVVPQWFNGLSEIDALHGFARFAMNNQSYVTVPDVVEGDFVFSGENLGHPLIPANERVSNNITFNGNPNVVVITGANMAGKSTFLRTLAVNLILGMNGAPVCARKLTISPCKLISSINVRDSLAHNNSYFYAELLRLREIIDSVQQNPKTLIILDEILRGTNTRDKQMGSLGFLEKLISMNAIVVIATHDLVIGELEKKYPEKVTNYCFEVELEHDKLIFDYKLKDGISKKLNASFLMKEMGIVKD